MAAVKRILGYIQGTLNLRCCYTRKGDAEPKLLGYSDSDHAGDINDRKSTTGVLFYLGASPVTWLSQKQKVMALSSCEAEYIAASPAECEGVWLSRILAELKGSTQCPVEQLVDNKSAISFRKNLVYVERSKHIDTIYHYIRECVEQGRIEVNHITIGQQLVDLLTKPLGQVIFVELRKKVGVVDVNFVIKFKG